MAARIGITKTQVIEAGISILEEKGKIEEVSLSAVAERTGMRTQSLYAHIDGMKGLRRELALYSLEKLAGAVVDAAMGRAGIDAVEAILQAHLSFALNQPGLFTATIHPPGDDLELQTAINSVSYPLDLVLERIGIEQPERTHWTRLFLSVVYGFSSLYKGAKLTLPVPPENSADHLIRVLICQLRADALVD
jgi:AcrR family transcriptional regulator